jgi:two-component system cell cycle sensor histidine kinase/response regulator CckA
MGERNRKMGLDLISEAPWGTHLCQFYQTKEDLIDVLVPYFKAGLETHEFCMWVTSEPLGENEAKRAITAAVPDSDKYFKAGQMEIVPYTEWYLQDGAFDLQRVLNAWIDKLNQALANGYDGMRVTGNKAWLEKKDWKDFTSYEAAVNDAIGKYRMIAICSYALDKCGATEVIEVVNNHQFALIRRMGKWCIIETAALKLSREELQRTESNLKNIIRNSADGIIIVDQNGIVRFANPAAETLFGRKTGELIGEPFGFPVITNEATELSVFGRNGKAKTAEMRVVEVDWEEENAYLASLRDISERKQAQEAIEKERNWLRTIIDNLPDYIYVKDTDSRYIVTNNANARFLGLSIPEEVVGKSIFELFPQELAEKHYADDQEVVRKGRSLINREESLIDEVGKRTWNLSTKVPLRGPSGKIIGLVGIAKDITEHKKLQAQLQQSQKMEAIGNLAGGIAHDFNNLLTTIMGNADLASIHVSNNDLLHDDIEEIKKASERGASLVSHLLAFSRKQMIHPRVLDLNERLNDSEKMLRRLIGENIELCIALEPQLWEVKADPGQIDQVVMNLAVNARDAMPHGGTLTIETANAELDEDYFHDRGVAKDPGPYVILAISDTGIGMDKETQSHIFEPFFTTKEIGKGTGLGLSTVYGIAKQNNGYVWTYSEPGKGSTFKIYLPRAEGAAEASQKEKAAAMELHGSGTLLVVEDDDMLRKTARAILEKYGYHVLEAQDGEDALRVSGEYEGTIQLMITDVVMPKMNGRDLAKHLQPQRPEMNILYMSGYTTNSIVNNQVLDAQLAFLQKPFTSKELACKVREVLAK